MSNIPAGAGALLGQRLGNYEIVALLALGGTAEIYLAKVSGDSGFEKYVVVKCLHDHLADDEEFVKMFLDEARLAANLSHTNIAQTTALGSYDNRYYMVMEYLTGLSLAMVIRRGGERMPGGVLPVSLSLNIVQQACAGLHYSHEHKQNGTPLNIVHRDISPQNLVLTFEGMVKVVDFGIAKAEFRDTQTKAGTIKGKFAYMSPEQCVATGVDRRTDIFALGIIMHELLTGKRLFKRPNPYDTYQAVIDCKVLPPSKLTQGLDPALDVITLKALAKNKENRFATAEEFGDTLLQYMHSKGASGGPGEIARFFDQHFVTEIDEHNQRMRELISPDENAVGEDEDNELAAAAPAPQPRKAVVATPGVTPLPPKPSSAPAVAPLPPRSPAPSPLPSRGPAAPVAKPATAVPSIPAVGAQPGKAAGGAIPSIAGGATSKPSAAAGASAGAVPSIARKVIKPLAGLSGPERAPEPAPIDVLATADLILDEQPEKPEPGELSQFLSDFTPGMLSNAKPAVEDWGEPEVDPDDLPQENTRIEANPTELLKQMDARAKTMPVGLPGVASSANEASARPSAARFPNIANLATQLATDEQIAPSPFPVRGDTPTQPQPLNLSRPPTAQPERTGRTPSSPPPSSGPFSVPGPFDNSMPMGATSNRAASSSGSFPGTNGMIGNTQPPPFGDQSNPGQFNYPPGAQMQPQPVTNMPPPNWAAQNWSNEGTGPTGAAPAPGSLGPPLSGQFQMPPGAQLMTPVGEQFPQNVDWQKTADRPARAVPPWILALLFLVTLAVALAITVAIRKALA